MIIDLSELSDGFCSKLRVISYYLAVIIIKGLKKEIQIYEKKTEECPFLFTNLCTIKQFKIYKLNKKPYSEIIFTPYNYDSSIKLLKKKYFIKKKQNLKFNRISNLVYQKYTPNIKVRKRIKKMNLPKKFIGIHIRATDRELKIKNFIKKIQFQDMIFDFHTNHMIKNLGNFIITKKLFKNIFICSDEKDYKKETIKMYSSKLNIFFNKSKFNKKKIRQTNGIDFVTELFSLARSHTIITNVGGNVSYTAYLLSGKKLKVYKWIDLFNSFIIFKYLVSVIFLIKKIKNFMIKKII